MFVAAWTTGIGYMSAVIYYQAATFSAHPAESMMWIVGLLGMFGLVLLGLFAFGHMGRLQAKSVSMTPVTEAAR